MGSADIRAVMFDLDGTLLDTIADIAQAMNTVMRAHGLPEHPVNDYRAMVGSGLRELVRRATAPREADLDVLVRELHAAYAADPVGRTRIYPGVEELLGELHARGIAMGVLSNKADDLVHGIVERFFSSGTFASVRGMRDDTPAKPDPAGAEAVLAYLGVDRGQTLYLGDSDIDMLTARNAGMVAIGAAWGFRGADELRAAGADYVIDDPRALLDLVV